MDGSITLRRLESAGVLSENVAQPREPKAAQVVFFQSDERCEVSCKDREGKYQGQRGVTLPKP